MVDEDYCTPLHYAAMEGSKAIAEMLFEAAEKKVGWVNVKSVSLTVVCNNTCNLKAIAIHSNYSEVPNKSETFRHTSVY